MIESAPCPATSSTRTPKTRVVVLIESQDLRKAEHLIESCEHCNPDGAEIPFDNILDRITGSDRSLTDYILEAPAKCPNCRREILEKTLVEPTLTKRPNEVYGGVQFAFGLTIC